MKRLPHLGVLASRKNAPPPDRSEQGFKQLLDSVPHMILSVDRRGTIHWVNRQILDYIRLKSDTAPLSCDRLRAALHPEDSERVLTLLHPNLGIPKKFPSCEFRIRRHDGEYRWFALQMTTLPDRKRGAAQWLATCIDIQDYKLSTERLQPTHKLEVIEQVTQGLAHDLNNALNIVIGNLDMLVSLSADETVARRARVALNAAERGVALVQALMAPTRQQSRPLSDSGASMGKGSTATIDLPLLPTPPELHAAQVPGLGPGEGGNSVG